jgi:protein tyrosine phosphatase
MSTFSGCHHLGNFSIILQEEIVASKQLSMKVLQLVMDGNRKEVQFLHYTGWQHDLAPNSSSDIWKIQARLKYTHFDVEEHYNLCFRKYKGPIVCMSLSGVGRAGTYTAIEVFFSF